MMNSNEIRLQLDKFTAKHPEILCAYLFGSAAGGNFNSASDVDIALALDHPLTSEEKQNLRSELESMLGRDVDLVDLQKSTGIILRKALHGICILCRSTRVRYQMYRQLIYDQEDMQPLRNMTMQLRRHRLLYGH